MIAVNNRTLQANISGVQRYTEEVLNCLPDVQLLSPSSQVQGIKAHIWEQCLLPKKLHNRGLWSPANSGPLCVENQVVTIHDVASLDHPEYFSKKFSMWYRWLTPKLCQQVRGIITVSEFSKARLVETCGVDEQKIRVICNGIDSKIWHSSLNVEPSFCHEEFITKPYFLVVGSADPRKNIYRVLKAWQAIQDKLNDFTLVIVGAENSIFKSMNLPLVKRCLFTGYVSNNDLRWLYSNAYGLVYPSLYEGFGLPILEAMACGLPVITSNTTAIPEVAADAVIYVNPTSIDDIADAIYTLAESSSLHQFLQQKGIDRSSQFSWQQSAKQTREYLLEKLY